MGEAITAIRYYCHLCAQRVLPITEPDLQCPNCSTGFIEEIQNDEIFESAPSNLRSERALSLWAPVLLGMMGHDPIPDLARVSRRPIRREIEPENEEEEEEEEEDSEFAENENEDEIDREIQDIFRRSRRRSAILQLLESLREDMRADNDQEERESDRESLVLINSHNQALILQGDLASDSTENNSIGDYFLGPGLDLLLQHLAENDPTRYGTLPAKKESIEALPSVKITEEANLNLSCSVCLEDFEMGIEVKEMPCKHKFHKECILPWLELHSSCPVCRFELPSEERKESTGEDTGEDGTGESNNGGGNSSNSLFSGSWGFSGLFSGSGSEANTSSSSDPS